MTVVLVGSVKRDSDRVDHQAGTHRPAECGSAWVSGQKYEWLPDP